MTEAEDCVQVSWPPTPEEKWLQDIDGAEQARVVRPTDTPPLPPGADPNPPPASKGLDLSAYYWRGAEAGVRAGGTDGRWYVSLIETGSRPDRRVRPLPLVLDVCPQPELVETLTGTPLTAIICASGSALNGVCGASAEIIETTRRAVGRNPHWSPVCSGHFQVGDAVVVVGCTVPQIEVATGGIREKWYAQTGSLWQAGVSELKWIWRNDDRIRESEWWEQVRWTVSPEPEPTSADWEYWPWVYRFPESGSVERVGGETIPSARYQAYAEDIRRVSGRFAQPVQMTTVPTTDETDSNAIASLPGRLRGFILYTNLIRNRINRDSNVIRGLHGTRQQQRVCIERFNMSNSLPGVTTAQLPYVAIDTDGAPIDIRQFCGGPTYGINQYYTGGGGSGGGIGVFTGEALNLGGTIWGTDLTRTGNDGGTGGVRAEE